MNAFQIFCALSVISFVSVDQAIDEFLGQASAEEAAEAVAADPDLFSERQKAIALDMQVGPDGLPADILAVLDQSDRDYTRELREESEENIRNEALRQQNSYNFKYYTSDSSWGQTPSWLSYETPTHNIVEGEDGMLFQVRRQDLDDAADQFPV